MASNPSQHSGWGNTGHNEITGSSISASFYNGKYHSAVTVATTTTASFNGYGAVLLGNGAGDQMTKIHVAGGGIIDGNDLTVGVIYDISPAQVQSHGGNTFVFKRQQ